MAREAPPARYFHASIYRFEPEAQQAVIADFCTKVRDVSAQCWYDNELDMFFVVCPTAVGQNVADAALKDAFSTYVIDELAAAEREDRLPRIRRFLDDVSGDIEEPSKDALTESTSYVANAQASHKAPKLIFHLIAEETPSASSLKFFKLREVGEGVLEGVLAAPNDRFCKILDTGMSCRVARWSRGDHVFNGRIRGPLVEATTISDSDLFRSCTPININSGYVSTGTSSNDAQADPVTLRRWRFVGEQPTVDQWRDGMGEVELVDPNFEAEPPKDAKRFLKKPMAQTSTPGRLRVPKGAVPAAMTLTTDESDSEDENSGKSKGFLQLLNNGGEAGKTADSDSESTEDKDEGFAALMQHSSGGGSNDKSITAPSAPTDTHSTRRTYARTVEGPRPSIQNIHDLCSSSEVPRSEQQLNSEHGQQNENFPENSRFAKIDDIGLTSNAANQAEWEHANPQPRKIETNRSGVGYRTKTNTNSSSEDTISQSSAQQPPPSQSTKASSISRGPIESVSTIHGGPRAGTPLWTNNVVRDTPSSKKLIDDTALPGASSVKEPPGYDYRNNVQDGIDQFARNAGRENVRPAQNAAPQNHAETRLLIDFTESETTPTRAVVSLPSNRPLVPSRPFYEQAGTRDDDGVPTERRQPVASDRDLRQHTMRQQACKKCKASKSSAKGQSTPRIVVNLPKPEPPPPPKKKASTVPKSNVRASPRLMTYPSGASDSSMSERARSASNVTSESEGDKAILVPELKGLSRVVQELSNRQSLARTEVKVQFGLLLSTNSCDESFFGAVHETKNMQSRIQNASLALQTTFFPRLTTSENDARFLFSLVKSDDTHAYVEYEIQLKTSNGELRLVNFEQSNTKVFSVSKAGDVLAEAYMHYPVRVWDGKCTVVKPEVDSDLVKAVVEFIDSIRTIEQAPSFLASVTSHQFSIEKIYVKRVFSKMARAIELRVSEVQDLDWSAVHYNEFNIKATAGAPIEDQRLWWECSLHATTVGLEVADTLQTIADEFVSEMDDIGFDNQGPFKKREVPKRVQSAPSDTW